MADDTQPASYRLYGSEDSAFSSKLHLYMRYKQAKCEWITRTAENEQELRATARFDILPVLVTPSGYAAHGTSSVMEALETDLADNSTVPEVNGMQFINALLEEYADNWLNKVMIQYRWLRKREQKKAAARAVEAYFPKGIENKAEMEQKSVERMNKAIALIGLNTNMTAIIEASFKQAANCLAAHFTEFDYLLGARPCLADFALAGQLLQMQKDSAAAKILEKAGPTLLGWCERMKEPQPEGAFLPLAVLDKTLGPFITEAVSAFYLPWAAGNTEAYITRKDLVEVSIGKRKISHIPIKSEARSFRDLRRKFADLDDPETKTFLEESGAAQYLLRPPRN